MIDVDKRNEVSGQMAKSLHHYFQDRLDFGWEPKPKGWKYIKKKLGENPLLFWFFKDDYGSFLAPAYILTKFFYIFLGLFTMFFFNQMVGPGFYTFGIDVASNFLAQTNWKSISSQNFPKVTLCDIEIRQIGQPKMQTVQCVLTINLFNEKIFTIVWFWLVFLIFTTCFSLLWWLFKLELYFVRARKVLFLLKICQNKPQYVNIDFYDKDFQYFVGQYLKSDGTFIFEILEANSNETFCADLMMEMWNIYMDHKEDDEDSKKSRKKPLEHFDPDFGTYRRPKADSKPKEKPSKTMKLFQNCCFKKPVKKAEKHPALSVAELRLGIETEVRSECDFSGDNRRDYLLF